ncbi:MAG: hypothetical protein JNM09_21990 [Blastocatellia bacterium]|nr:hypothetical protein [Blastocatellia bacterium]
MKETPLLLRWREHPTFWQRLQSRVQTFWHRLWTPRIVVQPPLQPARHKPFPKRPHHRRRQAVFAVLATAPADATIHELSAHVRELTGIGCSRKLIVAWRQEREMGRKGDGEMGREGNTEPRTKTATGRRWRRERLRLFLLLGAGFNACATAPIAPSATPNEITISPVPSASSSLSNLQSPISNPTVPRLLRIKLTLNTPAELHIEQGDEVKTGDVLSDRRQARARLLGQQRALQSAQQHLQQQRQLSNESLNHLNSLGPELPPITFAAERAAIQRAETESLAVNRTVEIQRQKVSGVRDQVSALQQAAVLSHLTPDTRHLIEAHETAKLTQANDKQLLAHSEIELHKAKLVTAKEIRVWDEQKHRVEVTRQILSIRTQQQQLELELARLTAQLAEVNLQLAHLTEIRAPFAGIIKRIEWEDMNNETISVLVYLAVSSR